jgi:hypothetical protein
MRYDNPEYRPCSALAFRLAADPIAENLQPQIQIIVVDLTIPLLT